MIVTKTTLTLGSISPILLGTIAAAKQKKAHKDAEEISL